ncbi:MAG: PDZ domain-containing protein, partial [Planctomycetota bacterium]|nr:PDZ domain-containing protein [Planctomycetota bacterium]
LPETLEMDIAAGQLPATSGKFGRFKLADLFKMKKEETAPKETGAATKEEKPEPTRIPLRVSRPDSAPNKPVPWLGVSVQAPGKPITQQGGEEGEVGVEVVVVVPNAPAANAGLKVGDIIVGVGEIALKDCPNAAASPVTAFVTAIKRFGIGETKAVSVLRGGKRERMEATIGQRPVVEVKTRQHPELDALHAAEGQSILESALAGQGLTQEYLAVEAMVRATAGYSASQAEILPGQTDPFRLTEVNYLLQNPLDTHLVCDSMATGFESRGNLGGGTKCDLPALMGFAGECLDVPLGQPGELELSARIAPDVSAKELLEGIMAHFDVARKLRDQAFAGLTPAEIGLLAKMSDSLADKEVKPSDMLGILNASARIDCAKLFQAGRVMADLCRNDVLEHMRLVLDIRKIASTEEALPEGVSGQLIYSARTPMGLFLVGGKDRNTYAVDAALIIDLGGDDTYANNAGGTSASMPISLVIDFGGNDTYCAMRDAVQGAGNTGVGILVDVAGNDTYSAGNYAQGCGMYGVGILLDAAGDDMYRGDTCMQGAASFGLGFLIDSDGADRYNAHKFSQAFGSTKGYGALIDAAGADVYFAGGKYFDFREPEKAYQSLSQGFGWGSRPWEEMVAGASGGIGM